MSSHYSKNPLATRQSRTPLFFLIGATLFVGLGLIALQWLEIRSGTPPVKGNQLTLGLARDSKSSELLYQVEKSWVWRPLSEFQALDLPIKLLNASRQDQETEATLDETLYGTLILGPKSEILLSKSKSSSKISILVSRGEVHYRGKAAEIEVRSHKIETDDGSDWKLSGLHSLFSLFRGKASMGRQPIREGESVELSAPSSDSPETALAIRKTPFHAVSPEAGQIFPPHPNLKIRFEWEIDPKLTNENPMELEVAENPAFTGNIIHFRLGAAFPPLKKGQAHLEIPIHSPSWFWRIRLIQSGFLSPIQSFSIRSPQPPSILFPPAGFSSSTASFAWEKTPDAISYELELKNRGTEKEEARTFSVDRSYFSSLELKDGEYQWRVRAIFDSNDHSDSSEWTVWRRILLASEKK